MKQNIKNIIITTGGIIGIASSVFLLTFIVLAWTGPSSTPPTCPAGEVGCDSPLHTGTTAQSKAGGLLLNTGGAEYGLIVQNGKVGIGVESPTTELDVTGTVNATSFTGDGSQLSGIVGTPAGVVVSVAMDSCPTGYIKANGSDVSRTTYASLFSVIGTTFGSGDGSTTFTLPDLRGEFVRGFDDGKGTDSGRTFASFQADEFKSHNHGLISSGYPDTFNTSAVAPGRSITGSFVARSWYEGGIETRPRNIALLYCIKY